MAAARTRVNHPPTRAPERLIAGRPFRSTARSVVVPPISTTTASFIPVRAIAPMMLAAGPERIVSIGRSIACASLMRLPSPLTTIREALIPLRARLSFTASMRPVIKGISLALSTAVTVRS